MIVDETWIWAGAFSLAGLIIAGYLTGFRRRNRRDAHRLREARRLGIERPLAQYPWIDPARCVGCASCVGACPEGDVLGIVGGMAVVVNGLRCVGHGHCEAACAIGAISVGLGDFKKRCDIPLTDDWNETNVPGVFIAGELGGLALIRNAIEQGRRSVERIAERLAGGALPPGPPGGVDVAIVGAGPAGLSAALAASEAGLSYLVLEQEAALGGTILHYPRRKLVLTQPVELPLAGWMRQEEYTKEELLELFETILRRHHLRVRFGERILEVVRGNDGLLIRGNGDSYRSRALVLAMGRRGTPRRLGVPGEELSKVMYQLRDANSYRHRRILVVGGGDSAVEAAMSLARQPGNEVTLSYRREQFVRIKQKNQLALEKMIHRGRLRSAMKSRLLEIAPGSVRLEADGRETRLDNDYVFVLIGGEPPFPFLRQLGIRFGGDPERDTGVEIPGSYEELLPPEDRLRNPPPLTDRRADLVIDTSR